MFYRSLHHSKAPPFIQKYDNRMINRTIYNIGSPRPPPNMGIILLGGVLCWYVFIRRL